MLEINGSNNARIYVEKPDEDAVIVSMSDYRAAYSLVRAARDAVMTCRAILLETGMPGAANEIDPRRISLPTRPAFLFLVNDCNLSPKVANLLLDVIEFQLNDNHEDTVNFNLATEEQLFSTWVVGGAPSSRWEHKIPTGEPDHFIDPITGCDIGPTEVFDPNDPKV